MLPKEQADRVGDAIIEQARLTTLSRQRRLLDRIPLLCRCQELDSLPRSEQADVIRQASQELQRSWSFILFSLGWACASVGAFWTLKTSLHNMSNFVLPFVIGNWAVLKLLRGLFMRHRVWTIAAQLHGEQEIADLSRQ